MSGQLENARFGEIVRSADGGRFVVLRGWNGDSVRAMTADAQRERWCLRYDASGRVERGPYQG